MQGESPGPKPGPGSVAPVDVGDLVDGKYRLLRIIGEGGWGIVYEGENLRTLRRVAIKILRAQANVTPDVQARFEREAQAAGRIGSEHIVEVFDLGSLPDGTSYMVMELLTGHDLATRLESGPLDAVPAALIIIQLLEGLSAAHQAGILHRDLKPENLFLVPTRTGEEFVKILDFGISKFNSNIPGAVSATMTGAVLGSPVYMAPEQARGLKQIDARADLYSVGALFYECVTGKVPFEGENFNDLMFKIVLAPRPNPLDLRPDLDPGLVPILVKAIAVEPQDRYQTADDFRAAITSWLGSMGVEASVPPEPRRGGRPSTLRSSPGNTPTGNTPTGNTPRSADRSGDAHWSAATVSAESGTPLPASATIGSAGKTRRGPIIVAVVAAAALLGGGAIIMTRHHPPPASTASGSAQADTQRAPTVPSTGSGSSTVAANTAASPPSAAPTLAATSEPEPAGAGAANVGHTPAGVPRGHWTPPGKGHDAGAAPSEPKVADSPPPPPPPTSTAPVSTVEGRAIRTGL
jgi:serine/threonine-protein kinase